jgi:uncharacterized protein YdhG (YjbR/CyaY superfamily)
MNTESDTFSEDERIAMRERAKELKAAKKDGVTMLLEKVAEMPESDRVMAEKIHQIVTEVAPELGPKTWYGMPAYANKDGKVVCFFQSAAKFGARYATLGFNEAANLDEGTMWTSAFALTSIGAAEEARIRALVKQAVS